MRIAIRERRYERKSLLGVLLAFSVGGALFSCAESVAPRDDSNTDASHWRLRDPRFDLQGLPPAEADLSAQAGTITVASYPFVEGVIADITISGRIALYSDPRAYPINYSGPLDHAGVGVPYGSCLVDAKLYF